MVLLTSIQSSHCYWSLFPQFSNHLMVHISYPVLLLVATVLSIVYITVAIRSSQWSQRDIVRSHGSLFAPRFLLLVPICSSQPLIGLIIILFSDWSIPLFLVGERERYPSSSTDDHSSSEDLPRGGLARRRRGNLPKDAIKVKIKKNMATKKPELLKNLLLKRSLLLLKRFFS